MLECPPAVPTCTSAAALVQVLRGHGVDRVFCVAGESYLAVLDELYADPGIDVVTCRHEASAGFAAIADAQLTGRAGVCLVSRGPGATNACVAVHSAFESAVPLVLVVGQVTRAEIGQESFQEIDCHGVFASMAKGVWTVLDPAATAGMFLRALRVAESGTPGPVVLAVPDDVLTEPAALPAVLGRASVSAAPAGDELDRVLKLLASSVRPILLAGGGLATGRGRRLLRDTADLLDNRHPCYAGQLHNNTQPAQLAEFRRADLVLAVGTRLDVVTTRDGAFPAEPQPEQPLVHVHPDPARLGARYRAGVAIACDAGEFLAGLLGHAARRAQPDRGDWIRGLHELEVRKAVWREHQSDDGIPFGAVIAELDRQTGGEVTVTLDSGTFTSWLYRYLRVSGSGRMLGLGSSAMGFGVPAGVAAALRSTGPVVAVVGDGGFGMTGSELATAVARQLRLIVLIANNGSYATIRAHQERHYPNRVIGTDLVNPDFARLADAYGVLGLSVTDVEQVPDALARALRSPGPVVLDVRTSLKWISAYRYLSLPEAVGSA